MCNRQILGPNPKLHSKEVFEGDFLEGDQLCPERHVGFGKVRKRVRVSICNIRVGERQQWKTQVMNAWAK